MDSPAHILVIDDDARLRDLLGRYLTQNGFIVTTADSAEQARQRLTGLRFDLAVVDVMMAGEDGLSLIRAIRQADGVNTEHRDLPILLLTARGDPQDRIAGLEAGADDYLGKPFEPKELLLRIHAILRRITVAPPPAVTAETRIGGWKFEPDRECLTQHTGAIIRLTRVESSLLKILWSMAGQPISREELTRRSDINGNERTVDVTVTRLRRKIEEDPKNPRYLLTARGEGYVLRPDS
jgi:two-component system phosphate regulon response regulator OmpR